MPLQSERGAALGTYPCINNPSKEVLMTVLLDPTSERSPTLRPRLPRPDKLDGLTVGLLDIAKARGDVFLDRLDQRLKERGIAVKRYKKPTNTRPAPLPLQQQIATEVNLVIEGLSD
jgi:hypothetical protein